MAFWMRGDIDTVMERRNRDCAFIASATEYASDKAADMTDGWRG